MTMDALFALALLLVSVPFVIGLLSSPDQYRVFGAELATDTTDTLRTVKLTDLSGNAKYPYANSILSANLTDTTYNSTLMESIAELHMKGNTTQATQLAREVLEKVIPVEYGVELLIESPGAADCSGAQTGLACIYNRTGPTRYFASVGRHIIYSNDSAREIRVVLYK